MNKTSIPTEFAPTELASEGQITHEHTSIDGLTTVESVLDAMSHIVFVLNEHRQIVFANRAFYVNFNVDDTDQVLGLRPGEAIGCIHATETGGGCGTTKHCRNCGAVLAILNSLAGKEDMRECRINRGEDGNVLYLLVKTEPLRIAGKTFAIVSATDITELKAAEQRQAAMLDESQSINSELTDFAHIVSHDLKAPLRGIQTLAEWLATDFGDRLGDEGKEQMGLLIGRVNRMQDLIDGILHYSRVTQACEDFVTVDLNELVTETIDILAPPKHISVTIDTPLPTVSANLTRLKQLFQNLLSNAIKYMDKDHGIVRIGHTDLEDRWQFFVADNGPGIPEEHFDRIFKIFQTLSLRDQRESTGVGLTVAKKIAELHGGQIWVESQVGKGTTFLFTLPKQGDR